MICYSETPVCINTVVRYKDTGLPLATVSFIGAEPFGADAVLHDGIWYWVPDFRIVATTYRPDIQLKYEAKPKYYKALDRLRNQLTVEGLARTISAFAEGGHKIYE